MDKESNEIILIDKPGGITSYDVIRTLKRAFPGEKIGHAGTLDPLATGLLLVGVGKGTKKLRELVGLSKEYAVTALLGIQTDTGDIDGKIINQKSLSSLLEKDVRTALSQLIGNHILPVPLYSATKIRGRALYTYARKGVEVEHPKREMEMKELSFVSLTKQDNHYLLSFTAYVGSGTYIRSLVEEIGKKLSVPATVSSLRRVRIGDYNVEDAQNLSSFS